LKISSQQVILFVICAKNVGENNE